MRTLFLVLVYGALCRASSASNPDNVETLMDNVLVVRAANRGSNRVNVSLTCGQAYHNQPVFWKKNGELRAELQGNQVTVLVRELDGGNYTCHLGGPDGEYLNHTLVLIQVDPENGTVILEERSPEEGVTGGHIQCTAPNNRGPFHCTWTRAKNRATATVLLVQAQRDETKIPCELDADGSGLGCVEDNCPYKEEEHRVILTIYIYSYARLEAYTKAFYLRDIVRPEKLPNLRLGAGQAFSWSYPESWDKPCSYFSLLFQVRAVHSGETCSTGAHIMEDTTDQTEYELKVKTKRYVFCVRAQDKHTRGPFSDWSYCVVHKDKVTCH